MHLANALPDIDFVLGLREFSFLENRRVECFLEENRISGIQNIKVVRNIPNMVNFYKEVDAVILPVKDSVNTMSAPLVLLEALASGCLVFVNKIPIFEEYSDFVRFFDNEESLRLDLENINTQALNISTKTKFFIDSLADENMAAKIYLKKYE